jgi:hypothetical protein
MSTKSLIAVVMGLGALAGLGMPLRAAAHHSTASYDYRNTKTLSGTVKEFQWTNPHMFIKVMVPDAQGKPVEWNVECGTPNLNARHGWKKTDVKAGDAVTMEINPMRDGTPAATLRWVQLPDGRKLWGPGIDFVVAAPGAPNP